MKKRVNKNWITVLILALAGGLVYKLPYLKNSYYDALCQGLNVNNTQLGVLVSAFGVSSMVCYFPGGWVADRFKTKTLLALAFISLGALGMVYSFFPPYKVVLLIHILFGVSICLLYWSVSIKAVRMLSNGENSGKMYGFWEGGKQVSGLIISYAALAVFIRYNSETLGLASIIRIYSTVLIAVGVLLFFLLKDMEEAPKKGNSVKEILSAVSDKRAWIFALMIFSAYHFHISLNTVTPYLTQVFGLSSASASAISMFILYVIGFIGASTSGILVDKQKSTLKVVKLMVLVGIVSLVAYIAVPARAQFLFIVIALWGITQYSNFAIRGVYFSALDEIRVEPEKTGLFIGFASFIGFIPDTYLHVLNGKIMDMFPGAMGFKIIFGYMAVMMLVCFGTVTYMYNSLRKEEK